MNIILKTKFGSHLYGTDTPESDLDIKGIFLPELRDVLLQKVPKEIDLSTNTSDSKNSKEDIDEGYYSLHYFLKLAFKGETVAIDLLSVRPETALNKTYAEVGPWEFIYKNRAKFYTKNMKAFLGYCRTQAAKYGVRAERLNNGREVLAFLKDICEKDKANEVKPVGEFFDQFPKGKHIIPMKIESVDPLDNNRAMEVCNRKIMYNTKVYYTIQMVEHFCNNYGERAKLAAKNEGIDWKAISHAFRAGYQLEEIYLTGDLQYPLRNRTFLRELKQGHFHYQNDNIAEKLENLISKVESLADSSTYPEKVDQKFWEDWLVSLYA